MNYMGIQLHSALSEHDRRCMLSVLEMEEAVPSGGKSGYAAAEDRYISISL